MSTFSEREYPELRLFVEELVTALCRQRHAREGAPPQAIRIRHEYYLGPPSAFADLRIEAPTGEVYFVEIKLGYGVDRAIESIRRKYSEPRPSLAGASRVIVVLDRHTPAVLAELQEALAAAVRPGLELELWDESRLRTLAAELLGADLPALSPATVAEARGAVDHALGRHALGERFRGDALDWSLVWHFGPWHLRGIASAPEFDRHTVWPYGQLRDTAVVYGDIAGFSGYVRDTADEHTVRTILAGFYAKVRLQIFDCGGVLYQFLGDGAIALFPAAPGDPQQALVRSIECAEAMLEIGQALSHEWQRQIDRMQPVRGLHIGIALGDLITMPMHPFGSTPVGAIGDPINVAARLCTAAGPDELLISNTLHRRLPIHVQHRFAELDPVEAKNVGRLKSWRLQGVPRFEP